jgi:plastocyanin
MKHDMILFRIIFFLTPVLILFFAQADAEEYNVIIPFGAYNPELNTPAEVWYDPPTISVTVGDTVMWINEDREGHTVTSGQGSGRFGWMGDDFGSPDGIFESGRFMLGDSWSHTFQEEGTFRYFCVIHPWMEGIINVEQVIPDYPHDALGNRIEQFPVIEYTTDRIIEVDMTWEPNVIKTFEKVVFIYHTYDPATNSNLDKMNYDIIIIQNGRELFRDNGLTQVGGDYRNFIFEEPGTIEIRFENIVSGGSSGIESSARAQPFDPSFRTLKFTAMVYENPEKTQTTEVIVQPKQTLQLYYEFAVAIILIPAVLFIFVLWHMKSGKQIKTSKATPV